MTRAKDKLPKNKASLDVTKVPPEKSLAFQIRRVHLAFDRLLTARLSPHGVKAGYYNYLRALWIKDGVTQRHLSAITRVTETTSVALLKGMAAEGLVVRNRGEEDRRKSFVCLTEKGRALEPILLPHAKELNGIALNQVDANELEICFRVLNKVASNLEALYLDDA